MTEAVRIEDRPVSIVDGRWSQSAERYRVYFWEQQSLSDPPAVGMWECDAHQLLGARDIGEVLSWAHDHASERIFTVYVEVDRPNEGLLVHIYGIDPTVPALS